MTHSRSTSSLGLQFNAFLFATIDEGTSEEPLSVVSALARLDLDPWQEAAELTRLPRDSAAQRLGALLTKLPSGNSAGSHTQTVALRLIALLPCPAGATKATPRVSDGSGASARVDPTVVMMLFILMSFIAMATSGLTGHPSPAPAPANVAPAAAAASGAALPNTSATKAQP
jgi:hypothetical protein